MEGPLLRSSREEATAAADIQVHHLPRAAVTGSLLHRSNSNSGSSSHRKVTEHLHRSRVAATRLRVVMLRSRHHAGR